MKKDSKFVASKTRLPNSPKLVAVIDIGATSLRMQIAEINRNREVRKLESYSQAVSIGKDSFAKGYIRRETIEDCVHVLQTYRDKLVEFGIHSAERIRVIATSGVREASNRLTFVDRIFVATGFEIEPFEEAELHRVTYLGILPFLEGQPKYFEGNSLVIEVGGGTSEVLLLNRADVAFARTYRLGALRLRNAIDRFHATEQKSRGLMESHVLQVVNQLKLSAHFESPDNFVAMGGDVRFAAKEINQQPVADKLVRLPIDKIEQFTNQILNQSPDTLATKYHMSLPDAQTLGPALLTNLVFAKEFKAKHILVANVSLRDGLLQEMAEGKGWSDSIQQQIVQSAIQTGRKFQFDEEHAKHVSGLACTLFDQLQSLHQLPDHYRRIIQIAALLHDIGIFVNSKSRHKHSMYLIQNSEFFGIGSADLNLISLVARYHRGAKPQPTHENYSRLGRRQRVVVAKIASLLRLAKALDATFTQRIHTINSSIEGDRLRLFTTDVADITIESIELAQAGGLFEDIFGKRVSLELNGDDA